MKQRSADPYRDLDVIDSRAPRFNQATIGALALAAFVTSWWPLLAILAAQLAIGLTLGRRWCLPCLAYFELVQPRFGEGRVEDSRPPRFANMVGTVFLGAAAIAHALGLTVLGWTLGLLVAGLALAAAATGFCAGCEIYRLGARLRGVRSHRLDAVDLADFDLVPDGEVVLQFTHPLCTDCRTLERRLRAAGRRVVTVDVSRRPELARKYGVALVPTAVVVAGTGRVTSIVALGRLLAKEPSERLAAQY
jgi:hypothetical protein